MFRDAEYTNIVEDIFNHQEFQKLKTLDHHNSSVYEHSVSVSYLSYRIAKKLGLDYRASARAGLLHDFFLYDWREEGKRNKKKLFEKHGFTHPKEALSNAKKHFNVNAKEEDIIVKHMFPLCIVPPKHLESWLVTMVDKYYAIAEYYERYKAATENNELSWYVY